MAKEELRYDRMVEDALRSVVRRALTYVSEHGLPGNHHFYITFRTDQDGVEMPSTLRDRYPGEMTIVLQHQFWGLEIAETEFSVTLSFADVPHRLLVPFSSVTAFADPSVRFGLQFDVDSAAGGMAPREGGSAAQVLEGAKSGLSDQSEGSEQQDSEPAETAEADGDTEGKDETAPAAEKVVTLDAFRKK